MRRPTGLTIAVLGVAVLGLGACGGAGEGASGDSTIAATAPDAPVTAASDVAETDTTPAASATEVPVATDTPDPVETASGPVEVTMVEWAIEAPTTISAGPVTFDITNGGSFAHHFAVARGSSYETLPQLPGGAVDEATLGADFLGRTDNLQGGAETTIDFDLEPGSYVLFCNIAGAVSHAAQGQVLAITVE